MKLSLPFLERAILWGIYALLATPLLFSNRFLFPAMAPKLLWFFFFSEVTFVLCLWLWRVRPSTRVRITSPLIWFFLFVSVLAVSSVFGVYPMNSIWGSFETNTSLLVWGHLGLVLISVLTVVKSQKVWINIAVASVVVGLVVSVLHLFSFLPQTTIVGFNSGSTLGNSSFLGTYLLFELFFAVLLALSTQKRERISGALGLVVFFYTLFSTDAAATTLSVVGGAVLFASLVLLGSKQRVKKYVGGFATVSLAVLLVLGITLAYQESALHRWIVEHSSGSRFVVADIAWEAFLERPLLGWGPENFRFAFLSHFDPCFGGEYCGDNILFDRAHNVFFDTLVTGGLLGGAAYVALWIGLFASLWQAFRRDEVSLPVAALVVSVLAAYLVQNLAAFDTVVSLLFFTFLYGFVVSLSGTTPNKAPGRQMLPMIATMALPVCVFFFVLQPLRGVASVKVAATSSNTLARFEAYQTAVSVSPMGRDVRRNFLVLQTANLLWGYDPVSQADTLETLKPYFAQEMALAETTLRETLARSPNDLRGYLYLLKLLQVQGRLYDEQAFAQAHRVLEEARKRNPYQVIFLWVDVALRLEQADVEGAREKAREAVALAPDHATTQPNLEVFEAYLNSVATGTERFALLAQFYVD